MPEDLKIETPGDAPVDTAAAAAERAEAYAQQSSDDSDMAVAALKTENAQLRATVELLNEQLADASVNRADAAPAATPKEPRLIGQNWGAMTAAEAKEAGCTQTVLCRDGYYVPA